MRLPTPIQQADIFGSLRRITAELDSLQERLERLVEREQRAGSPEHDGYRRGGGVWNSSTEVAAIARAEGKRPRDPQRKLLDEAVEKFVRCTAGLHEAKWLLDRLEAMQDREAA
jgi:hypothetical protein